MKLIIDIPEQMYLNAKADLLCGADIIVSAIKNGIPHETVTEFADRCRECGREKVLDKIRAEIENATSRYIEYKNDDRTDTEKYAAWWELDKEYFLRIIDKYRTGSNETQTNEIVYDVGGHMYGVMGGDVITDILAGKGKK